MDYKKIIAATAVTSAAFVVPAVVDAADVSDIITVPADGFQLGQVITAPEAYGPTGSAVEKITEYEWFSVEGSTATSISKSKTFTVPTHPELIKELKLVIKTESAQEFTQAITFTTEQKEGISFFQTFASDGDTQINFEAGKGFVNQPIQVIVPGNVKIMKYDWYIVDGSSARLVGGEEDQIIDIPLAASGKTLRVIMTDEKGKKYIRDLEVNELELNNFELGTTIDFKLNGNAISTDTKSIAPGDMLSVENLVITAHTQKIEILPSQAIVSYQWFYSKPDAAPNTYSIIPGATGPMYLVPDNAFGRDLDNISVGITVEVPDSGIANKTQYLYVYKLDNSAAKELETDIITMLPDSLNVYTATDIADFTLALEKLKGTYDNLSTGSKALVPSYPKVTQALQDIKTVRALISELDAFTTAKSEFEADPSQPTHAKLLKQFETIEKKYQKFDSLKRSVLEMSADYKENYVEVMSQHLKNLTQDAGDPSYNKSSLEFIGEINAKIKALFDQDGIYTFDELDEDIVPQTRAGMMQQIKLLEAEIKQVAREQQPIINSSLLKTAKSDLKKADAVGEKIAVIATATSDKKIKAILAARTAFDKLSFMQQSLISSEEHDSIYGTNVYSEQTAIKNLSTAITQLVDDTSYVFEDYTGDLLEDATSLPNAVDVLLAQYKLLNAKAKKSVINYAILTQAKKDLAAANKVVKAITNAYDFDRSTPPAEVEKKLKSIQSKYRSAYNAYVKLTPLQRSIVEEFTEDNVKLEDLAGELENLTNDVFTPDPESELSYDPSGVVGALDQLEGLISGEATTVQEVEDKIKEVTNAYKELNAAEKKGVYNYSILARAKTVAKKAASVETTLTNALNSGTTSRMISAVNAYNKLSDAQKNMISDAYGDVETALQSDEKDKLKDDLELFDLETFTLETLEVIQLNLALVDKKEYQNYPGYQNYLQALKIQKAVDSFLKKFNKLDPEPTYSKKQSILKDFKKLTQQQLRYFSESYEDEYKKLTEWESQLNKTATDLNDNIGTLIVIEGGPYSYKASVAEDEDILNSLEIEIANINEQYKALDSKERKLVTHYSFISKIERDIKAVRKAIELKNTPSFQQTYNRLTNQQQYLYNLVEPPTTP